MIGKIDGLVDNNNRDNTDHYRKNYRESCHHDYHFDRAFNLALFFHTYPSFCFADLTQPGSSEVTIRI
jgi:hypothetical protein